MLSAFVPCPMPFCHTHRASLATCTRPTTCRLPPPTPPRNRRIRVHRKNTSESKTWEWNGRKSVSWRTLFNVEENVIKVIEALWSKSLRVADSPIMARMTALGVRVLRRVTDAIERTLYPDTDQELAVEYGITDPSPSDKTFVDPLKDWNTSNVTYYRDSFGRRVYLQLDGALGFVAASDYRELCEDYETNETDATDPEEDVQFFTFHTEASFSPSQQFSRPESSDDPLDTSYQSSGL